MWGNRRAEKVKARDAVDRGQRRSHLPRAGQPDSPYFLRDYRNLE